mgnify:CR=1 FL=1
MGHTLLALLQKAFAGKDSARAKVLMIIVSNLCVSPIQQGVYSTSDSFLDEPELETGEMRGEELSRMKRIEKASPGATSTVPQCLVNKPECCTVLAAEEQTQT